ncbi:hypothetical protein [Streptomyces sp. NBC_00576]|uniref:hypothetical protein n=1 Tax=Streptomyces sp. NBC_00576 TaxID=2903665 RepID=UPI002E809CC1|nr:hypothetical protein [Streptomyces sp. NBC_00576]WUB76513.1 hypothetical protein OG734_44325 [Streptomyces sp. NBC_00576]
MSAPLTPAGTGADRVPRLILVMRSRFIPREESRQTMHLFAEEIMPHLRHLAA